MARGYCNIILCIYELLKLPKTQEYLCYARSVLFLCGPSMYDDQRFSGQAVAFFICFFLDSSLVLTKYGLLSGYETRKCHFGRDKEILLGVR